MTTITERELRAAVDRGEIQRLSLVRQPSGEWQMVWFLVAFRIVLSA